MNFLSISGNNVCSVCPGSGCVGQRIVSVVFDAAVLHEIKVVCAINGSVDENVPDMRDVRN